jgi:hypothetical protein
MVVCKKPGRTIYVNIVLERGLLRLTTCGNGVRTLKMERSTVALVQ